MLYMLNPEMLHGFQTYQKNHLLSDIFAALMVVVVALPLSIALGIQSGGTLQMGIVSAIIGSLCIAVFGGSKFSIGGPSASFIALCAGLSANALIGLHGLFLAVVIAGVLLMLAGILRAGRLLELVPNTVVVGLTAGIGVILLFGQFKDLLGLSVPPLNTTDTLTQVSPFLANLIANFHAIDTFSIASFCVGIFTLGVILILPKLHKKIPPMIVAVVISAVLTAILGTLGISVATIGSSYTNLTATFDMIDFTKLPSEMHLLIVPSLTFALVVALEGYTSATVGESLSGRAFLVNRELFGHGVANVATGLCGGLPVVGALARTNVNIKSGAKSALAGILSAVILFIVYIAIMPVMQFIPLAALAAVLIKVAINMSRFKLFGNMASFGKRDSAILISAFVLTIVFGVLYGVLASTALAVIVNIRYIGKRMRRTPIPFCDMKNHKDFNERFDLEGDCHPAIQAFHLTGSIFFGNVGKLIAAIKKAAETVDMVVIDLEEIDSVDASSVAKLAKLTQMLAKNEKRLVLYNLTPSIYRRYVISFEQIVVSWK